ncbi:MAG TPA: AtpZ/AtpI family protein [Gemmataceae bacterium]|jgi:F0F1-type ATP synthase assembly protein I|nr:AtpZ/AtpI family protein [Gemmataceae bacterium]
MSEDSPEPSKLAEYAALSQVGLEMVAPIGLGVLLDYWIGWGPWGVIGGAILGLVGGMAHLVSILNTRSARETTKRRRDEK